MTFDVTTLGSVHLLQQTPLVLMLHTDIRDRDANPARFVASSKRLLHLAVEESIGLLPVEERVVTTPIGRPYPGLQLARPICGVSVVRAGESMETVLREIVPGAPVGKILIQRDRVTKLPRLYYSHLPPAMERYAVLLFEPMLATGGSALAAIDVLVSNGVEPASIVLVNLLSVPEGISAVTSRWPGVRVVTTAIDKGLNADAYMVPGIGDFGDRFFGTDR